jgi:hypothetical protein
MSQENVQGSGQPSPSPVLPVAISYQRLNRRIEGVGVPTVAVWPFYVARLAVTLAASAQALSSNTDGPLASVRRARSRCIRLTGWTPDGWHASLRSWA